MLRRKSRVNTHTLYAQQQQQFSQILCYIRFTSIFVYSSSFFFIILNLKKKQAGSSKCLDGT
jgi:hypothetical protein